MGNIEETSAALRWRDSRILTIFEGTTGIQTNDLFGRKIMRDGGAAIGDLRSAIEFDARSATDAPLDTIGESLAHATLHASTTVDFLGASGTADPRPPFAGAVPFLHQMGIVIGGYVLFKAANNALAQITGGSENPACSNKLASAKFYATHILPQAKAYKTAGTNSSHGVFSIEDGAL